jgi:uncharacterized protein (TIGR02145 family)
MKTVKIGDQTWSSENLAVIKFNNGDEITLATSLDEWKKLNEKKSPVCCYYEFDQKNNGDGGLLYNWYAVSDERDLAPDGWRIPNDKDWSKLIDFCGKKKVAGTPLKSQTGWTSWGDEDPNGTNETGFNIMSVGYLNNRYGGTSLEFMNQGYNSIFWTSTQKRGVNEVCYWSFNSGKFVERETTDFEKDIMGLSVRLIK